MAARQFRADASINPGADDGRSGADHRPSPPTLRHTDPGVQCASGVTPGETIHCYQGMDKVFSQRVRQFNAALVDASAELGFSIVDVDRIVAEHGARHVKIDPIHLNALGCRLVAKKCAYPDDHGLLPEAA